MLDNKDINVILEKLENMEDEELAVELLMEFNSCSGKLGKLLLNLDKNLAHDIWKNECDKARFALDTVVKKINDL